jgi:hypothetical protein
MDKKRIKAKIKFFLPINLPFSPEDEQSMNHFLAILNNVSDIFFMNKALVPRAKGSRMEVKQHILWILKDWPNGRKQKVAFYVTGTCPASPTFRTGPGGTI